jgi:hypothetical protein
MKHRKPHRSIGARDENRVDILRQAQEKRQPRVLDLNFLSTNVTRNTLIILSDDMEVYSIAASRKA